MNKILIAAVAVLSLNAFAFAQGTAKKLAEPKCCAGKKCKHATGEDKHHKCNKHCHGASQKKGTCCAGINKKPAAKPAAKKK